MSSICEKGPGLNFILQLCMGVVSRPLSHMPALTDAAVNWDSHHSLHWPCQAGRFVYQVKSMPDAVLFILFI